MTAYFEFTYSRFQHNLTIPFVPSPNFSPNIYSSKKFKLFKPIELLSKFYYNPSRSLKSELGYNLLRSGVKGLLNYDSSKDYI